MATEELAAVEELGVVDLPRSVRIRAEERFDAHALRGLHFVRGERRETLHEDARVLLVLAQRELTQARQRDQEHDESDGDEHRGARETQGATAGGTLVGDQGAHVRDRASSNARLQGMRTPTLDGMPADLRAATLAVASTLRAGGAQSWLVGGAVRDLALGRAPKDVDLATDAHPERVEQLFPAAKGVGRAFGTMLVVHEGVPVQVTTFRSERGYSDARRPDQVSFGASAAEDAARRDFTCNAMFLDPHDGRLFDPQGGLADLGARRLRCVGDPAARFREDGLRLLRLARFAADLDLTVEPATLAGARASVASIAGVSGERVLAELSTIFSRPRAARALRLLHELGVIERTLPGLRYDEVERRCAVAERCPDPLGVIEGLAVLFCVEVLDPARSTASADLKAHLDRLHPSGEQRSGVHEVCGLLQQWERWSTEPPSRAELILAARRKVFAASGRLARASLGLRGGEVNALDAVEAQARAFRADELHPKPLLDSTDLAAAGIPKGPRWKELLAAAERAQLDLRLRSRHEALEWLDSLHHEE